MSVTLEDLLNLPWSMFQDELKKLTEEKVLEMLEVERTHKKRAYMLIRIHQRYSSMRSERERKELLK